MGARTRQRRKAIAEIGGVHVLAPTGTSGPSAYYRLNWIDPDGNRRHTSAGKVEATAIEKATEIAAGLGRAAGPGAVQTLAEVVAAYTSSPAGRNHKTGADWSRGHHKQVIKILERSIRGFEITRAMDVDRALLDKMRAQAGTRATVSENTKTLRGLLRWGATEGYFTGEQAELLPVRAARVAPARPSTPAKKRRTRPRQVGEKEIFIQDEDAPNVQQVTNLRIEMDRLVPRWGALAVELAPGSGARWGEQFQWTADDLTDGEVLELAINWQIDATATRIGGDGNYRCPPKGDKVRVAFVPDVSITGYPLREALLARRDAARAEQAAGTNPQALLFPAPEGGLLHHTSFMSNYFGPAARAAGWTEQHWDETRQVYDKKTGRYVEQNRPRRQFDLPWHTLRHRFARYCIDELDLTAGELMVWGGWENEQVVRERYYGVGAEHADAAKAKLRNHLRVR